MASAEFSSVISVPPAQLFQFLFQEGAWERGLPPDFQAERLEDGPFREGTTIRWRMNWSGFRFNWGITVERVVPNERVEVRQALGIFNRWSLMQTFEDHGGGNTLLKDLVEYEMPIGILGRLFDDLVVRREFRKILERRHEKIRDLVERKKT